MLPSTCFAAKSMSELGRAGSDLRGNALHFVVHEAVGYQNSGATGMIRLAGEIGDLPARFGHDEHPRCCVPRLQPKFPKRFEPAARHRAQIDRSRTVAPHSMRTQRKFPVVMNV